MSTPKRHMHCYSLPHDNNEQTKYVKMMHKMINLKYQNFKTTILRDSVTDAPRN